MTYKDGTGHDDDDLDQMMGSMRSMWRDMPDEEPPSRGLDALMAAARTKAAEMKPPEKQESWFRRALAMLARPPVLAAATVVVLVGSTVLLTQRDGGDRAATPTTQTFDDDAPGPANMRARSAEKSKESLKGGDQYDGAGSAAVPSAQPERQTRPRPALVPRPPTRDVKPSVAPTMPAPPPPPPPPAAAPETEPVVKEKPAVKQNGEDGNAPLAVDAVTIETTGRAPAPAGRPPTESSEQLLKQAETAASRKDCPAVRVTVDRIRKLDDRLYRSRVITQPAIKRCL